MQEICFCGWSGDVVDRDPIPTRDGEWALACPACGHIDRLDWLPYMTRQRLLEEARQWQHTQEAAGTRAIASFTRS